MSFPNISKHFFAKHVLVVTASAKYYPFSLLRRPHQQIITLEIAYVLIIFNPDQDGGGGTKNPLTVFPLSFQT